MLKQKVSNSGGLLPPVEPPASAVIGFVAGESAANEAQFKRDESHDRRMRRQRRIGRERSRNVSGWSVSLW